MPQACVGEIVRGKRAITTDTGVPAARGGRGEARGRRLAPGHHCRRRGSNSPGVGTFLRARFDEQMDRLDAALQSDEERFVAAQVDGMMHHQLCGIVDNPLADMVTMAIAIRQSSEFSIVGSQCG